MRLKTKVLSGVVMAVLAATLLVGTAATAGSVVTEGTLYTLDWTQGGLYTVNPATAAKTLVAPTAPSVLASTGIQYEPTDGMLYAVTYRGACNLFKIDPTTAASSLVGATGVNNCTGIDRQPGTGTFFVVYDISGGSELATVNKATGVRTDIAPVTDDGDTIRIAGLAFAPNGTLYGGEYNTDDLYSIDPATGVTTFVGTMDLNHRDPMGMSFDCSGTLYVNNNQDLYTVVPTTGATTLVGRLFETSEELFSENISFACGVPAPPVIVPPTPPTPPAAPTPAAEVVLAPKFTG
jgi:hypothetical protein